MPISNMDMCFNSLVIRENKLKQDYIFYPLHEQIFKDVTITNTDKM